MEQKKPINNESLSGNVTIATEKKKKKGKFSFFTATIYKLCSSSNTKSEKQQLPPSNVTNGNSEAPPLKWQKIIGSMLPLTLQEEDRSPIPHHQCMRSSPSMDSFEDAVIPPYSLSSTSTMSHYASATNLCAMDEHNGDLEDNDGVFDNKPADDMIDQKAEQFIARFHAQMRSQTLN